jgi:hypothetical protein
LWARPQRPAPAGHADGRPGARVRPRPQPRATAAAPAPPSPANAVNCGFAAAPENKPIDRRWPRPRRAGTHFPERHRHECERPSGSVPGGHGAIEIPRSPKKLAS